MSQSRHERDAYRADVLEQQQRARAAEAAAPAPWDTDDWRRWATHAELAADAERVAARDRPEGTLF